MSKVKRTAKLLLQVIVAIILGTVLMIAVYSLPVDVMREHVQESNIIQYREMDTYYWAPWIVSSKLDNFTDAIMLNNAVFEGTGSVVDDAMNNPYVNVDGLEQTRSLVKYVSDDSANKIVINYPRYWHGYLVWLKPLLLVMNYADIRVLFMFIQMFLVLFATLEIYKKSGYKAAVPFVFSMCCLNTISTAMCMQYACMYMITLTAALLLTKFELYKGDKYIYLFLWIGISTAFFDFFTYPILGIGINLILLLLFTADNWREDIKRIVYSSVSWLTGYAGMWGGKWIMASILTDSNVLKDGMDSAVGRSVGAAGTEVEGSSAWDVITNNIEQLFSTPLMWIIAILAILLIGLCLLRVFRIRANWVRIASLAVVALYPFGWYSVVRNHSTVHSWMTQRNLAVTVFAISIMITSSLYRDNNAKLTIKKMPQ